MRFVQIESGEREPLQNKAASQNANQPISKFACSLRVTMFQNVVRVWWLVPGLYWQPAEGGQRHFLIRIRFVWRGHLPYLHTTNYVSLWPLGYWRVEKPLNVLSACLHE